MCVYIYIYVIIYKSICRTTIVYYIKPIIILYQTYDISLSIHVYIYIYTCMC